MNQEQLQQQEDKGYTGCVPSHMKMRMKTGSHHSLRPSPISVCTQKDNWKEEISPDISIGKSSLYFQEKFQYDTSKNPFLEADTMNSHAQRVATAMFGKKTPELGDSLKMESNQQDETPSKTGTWSGNQQEMGNSWTSRPTFV